MSRRNYSLSGKTSPEFRNDLLNDLGKLRKRLDAIGPQDSDLWYSARELIESVDRFAGAVTGNRKYFWAKPHTAP